MIYDPNISYNFIIYNVQKLNKLNLMNELIYNKRENFRVEIRR